MNLATVEQTDLGSYIVNGFKMIIMTYTIYKLVYTH